MNVSPTAWIALAAAIGVLLVIDLLVVGRRGGEMSLRLASLASVVWIGIAFAFAGVLAVLGETAAAADYTAGYLVEKSLSLDNVFVFLLVFGAFGVAEAERHRLLTYGIVGALVMRAVFIVVGAAALERFSWIAFGFAALLVYTGWSMFRHRHDHASEEALVEKLRARFPIAEGGDGSGRLLVREHGKRALTVGGAALLAIAVVASAGSSRGAIPPIERWNLQPQPEVSTARVRTLSLIAIVGALVAAAPVQAAQVAGCPLLPRAFPTNQRVDRLPVHADSAAIVRSIGLDDHLHPDFGSGTYEGRPIGIPYDVVTRRTARERVRFAYADESDRVRYPIPRGVHIEGGRGADGDRHALLVDRDACRLYELFDLQGRPGAWSAGSGATWNLRSTRVRPAGWTSADAAGLPILPLLARHPEVRRGRIDHALRVTVSRSRRGYVYPARHFASSDTDPALPRMGERLRLKASVDISGLPRQARVIARALKRYGLIVADNGSDWFVSGAPHPRWDNDQLRALRTLAGRDFEVVDASGLRPR